MIQQPRIKAGKFLPLIDGEYDKIEFKSRRPRNDPPPCPEVPWADGEIRGPKGALLGYYVKIGPSKDWNEDTYIGYSRKLDFSTHRHKTLDMVAKELRERKTKRVEPEGGLA